jgi:hypothetical protein
MISPAGPIRTSKPAAARPDVDATSSGGSPGRHIVATTASVSPYAVSTVSKLSSRRIRSTSATGTSAAPVTASRRLDRSQRPRSGWSRIIW